jgi:hypothetical protein
MESTDCSSPEYSIGIVFARRVKGEKYALIGITNCRSLAPVRDENGRGEQPQWRAMFSRMLTLIRIENFLSSNFRL